MLNMVYFSIFRGLKSQKVGKISKKYKKWKIVVKNMLIFAYISRTVRDMKKTRQYAAFEISRALKWILGW